MFSGPLWSYLFDSALPRAVVPPRESFPHLYRGWYCRIERFQAWNENQPISDVLVSVNVGGDSKVGSVATTSSVSDDVSSVLYRSLKTANSTDSKEGSD